LIFNAYEITYSKNFEQDKKIFSFEGLIFRLLDVSPKTRLGSILEARQEYINTYKKTGLSDHEKQRITQLKKVLTPGLKSKLIKAEEESKKRALIENAKRVRELKILENKKKKEILRKKKMKGVINIG